jgi:hypothetical protein
VPFCDVAGSFRHFGEALPCQNTFAQDFGFSRYRKLSDVQFKALSSRLLPKNAEVRIYTAIILTVVLYGCETWSLTIREQYRLRVFENRVLRIFGSMRDEEMGGWRKLRNEGRRDLHTSLSVHSLKNTTISRR